MNAVHFNSVRYTYMYCIVNATDVSYMAVRYRIVIQSFSWQILVMLICGNKMPTRCNGGFYCRSYCLLNMFRGPLCPSSGAQEYYTVVAACGISCCGFSSCWSGVELRVMCPVCRMLQQRNRNEEECKITV